MIVLNPRTEKAIKEIIKAEKNKTHYWIATREKNSIVLYSTATVQSGMQNMEARITLSALIKKRLPKRKVKK